MGRLKKSIGALALVLSICLPAPGLAIPSAKEHPSSIKVKYRTSLYADFLFYLLYRSKGRFPELAASVPLDNIPRFKGGSFFPQAAALSNVSSYEGLFALLEQDDHVLRDMLQKAEPSFPAFRAFWQTKIEPKERSTIEAWINQERRGKPVAKLEAMMRTLFPFPALDMFVVALDPQGSSTQSPAAIFTTTEVPGLAWVWGHEGTHMALGPEGADWENRPNAKTAISLVQKAGGTAYDIEEALCLHLQAQMAIAAGIKPAGYRSSETFTKDGVRRTLLLALERNWPSYRAKRNVNAADFIIAETIRTLS